MIHQGISGEGDGRSMVSTTGKIQLQDLYQPVVVIKYCFSSLSAFDLLQNYTYL